MSPWLSLIVAFVVCATGAVLTYRPGVKDQAWFPWAMAGLSVGGGLCYGLAVRYCRSAGEVFVLSVAWDVVAAVVYVGVPVLLFGLRVSALGWCGLLLAAAGVVLLKVGGEK